LDKLLPLTEQLDRAAMELHLDHPLHNRLALILVDNAVELMVRYSLMVHTSFGGEYPDSLNTADQRRQARSQKFGDRLSMLVHVKELTRLEADFVLAAHEHRNAAYHEGFGGTAFLRPLCFTYYRFACRYLTRFSMAFHSWVSNFPFTETSQRYYNTCRDDDAMLRTLDRAKLAGALNAQLPVLLGPSLQDVLAADAEADRQAIVKSFRFLIENSRPGLPTASLLKKIQFEHARDIALEKKGLEGTHFDTIRRTEAVQFVKTTWKKYMPRYRAIPHGAWSQGIARIRLISDEQAAVVQFQRLRESMAFLRDAICNAAFDLEMELQSLDD
jgi:hypothetical protein